ncbi:MAG: ATP-binding protein [Chitinophagaceae bacterium]|nr:MAG: ATP-binding protein [Chitinophagaceae bacterium]
MKAHITTICSTATQSEVRDLLKKFISDLPIDESQQNQIVLAVDEALANAIIHGNHQDPRQNVQIDILYLKDKIRIEMINCGYFDIHEDDKKEKALSDIIVEKQKGGLGLKLIYSIMDVVSFYIKDNKTRCVMTKLIPRQKDESKA